MIRFPFSPKLMMPKVRITHTYFKTTLSIVAVLAITAPGILVAAPPAHDARESPLVLSGNAPSVTDSNAQATDARFDPGFHGLWYQWRATASSPYEIKVTSADFDASLTVYRVISGRYEELAPDPNGAFDGRTVKSATLRLFTGIDYRFLVNLIDYFNYQFN